MSEWAQTYDLNGKPVITVDKPGKRIEAVLDELQAKCINEIEGDTGSGETPVTIEVEPLTAQTMKIKASVDLSEFSGNGIPDGTIENQVLVWNGSEWVAGYVRAT